MSLDLFSIKSMLDVSVPHMEMAVHSEVLKARKPCEPCKHCPVYLVQCLVSCASPVCEDENGNGSPQI